MNEVNQNNLNIAIILGDAVCKELGICCEPKGDVIHLIYQELNELDAKAKTIEEPETTETPAQESDATEALG